MPFIISKINRSLSPQEEETLKTGLGQAVRLISGKSEEFLMLEFESNRHLWLAGQNDMPLAYIQVAVYGNPSHLGCEQFSIAVTRLFSEVLGISPEHIYIKYEDIAVWGQVGYTFGR